MKPALNDSFDVIAVGAHPDDIEIACGGTLARLVKQGYKVAIVDLTNGEPTPHCDDPAIRIAEAHKAAAILGVQRTILELPNRRLFDGFEARVLLATELRRLKPKIVIGFGRKTPMASPDHFQAMQITDAAVFYSRLTKWDEHFSHLPPHTVSAQLYFHLDFDLASPPERGCSLTVDVSDSFEQKMEAIRCYQTQFPKAKDSTLRKIEAFAIAMGAAAGFDAGEIFYTTRPLGCSDLVSTVLPGRC